ncbi:hypothetical protein [Dyadobacter sp. CY326]|uniref:hypothetical protein n=1 Tax=Dyadobacter sp. CY326 TaxID=2907300 RepID=UPI001F48C6A1|nr:hypothetical protein [Dyadobacter sp. CY326]MCE7064559.1 hypothetical protein [Dyadobacter sp. CY326]
MKNLQTIGKSLSYFVFCILGIALSCTDHETPEIPNDPESACTFRNGLPRTYPCEFKIEKLTFYKKDGSVAGEIWAGANEITLKRSEAKADNNPGATAVDAVGQLTFDVKATIKRIAAPSFPVSAGYQMRYTTHPSGLAALTTPGESYQTGSSVPLTMAIGSTAEVNFELSFLYQLANTPGGIKPIISRDLKAFLIYNDVTSANLDKHPSYIGDVAEASLPIVNKVAE